MDTVHSVSVLQWLPYHFFQNCSRKINIVSPQAPPAGRWCIYSIFLAFTLLFLSLLLAKTCFSVILRYLKHKFAQILSYCSILNFLYSQFFIRLDNFSHGMSENETANVSFLFIVSSVCCLNIKFLNLQPCAFLLNVWLVWLCLRKILIFVKVSVGM